jgi:uncharacterized protein YabE (DUF348 family)
VSAASAGPVATGEPDPADASGGPPGARRGHLPRVHRASRAHLWRSVRPSPARAEPHDSGAWLPLPDADALPHLDGTAPVAAPPVRSAPPDAPPVAPPPSPARSRPHDPAAWLPLPDPGDLPTVADLLERNWTPQESPARAEAPDPTAWLPLPDVGAGDADGPPPPRVRRGHGRPRARAVVVGGLLVGLLVGGGLGLRAYLGHGHSVEVRADGRRAEVTAHAETVGALLRDERIRLGQFDRVVPAPATRLRDGLTVTVLRAFPVTRDLDGDIRTVFTTYSSPSDYVRRDLGSEAVVIRSGPRRLQADSTIILRTPRTGVLLVDGAQVDYTIPALDLDELLAQYSVDLGPEDSVIDGAGAVVGRDQRLVDRERYTVVRLGREIVQFDEAYTAPPERRPDPAMQVGETRVEEGAPGTMRVAAEITRRNGEEVGRKIISRLPAVVSRPTITYFGTKADPMWDRIALCETAGDWSMQGPLYSGGLGFYNRTWDAFGGRAYAPNAGLATREEQILVAENIRNRVGIDGWGCAHTLGYVR